MVKPEIELSADESESVTFENVSIDEAGDYDVSVWTEDDEASTSVTVQGAFDVTIDSVDDEVTEGDAIIVGYTVENTGGETDTQDIVLEVDSTQEDSESVTLDGGETFEDSFTYTTDSSDVPVVDVTVESDDDTDSETVLVEEASAEFEVTALDLSETTVDESETFDVSATIENTGTETDEKDVELRIDDETEVVEPEIELSEDETESVTFENVSIDEAGEYTLSVWTEDDEASTSITVEGTDSKSITAESVTVDGGESGDITVEVLDENAEPVPDEQVDVVESDGLSGLDSSATTDTNGVATFSFTEDTAGTYEVTFELTADDSVTDTATVTVLEPAEFVVTLDSTNSPVVENKTLEVDATIENTGDVEATQSITLDADNSEQDSTTLTLGAGESTAVTLDWETSDDDAGSHTATVSSSDDADSTGVTVEEPAHFAVNVTNTTVPVEKNETLLVNATIENTGDVEATQSVALAVNDSKRDSTSVTLGPDDSTNVTLAWETEPDNVGNHTATVSSVSDSDSVTVTVESGDPRVSDYANDDDAVDTDGLLDAISDWQAFEIETELLLDVIDVWQTGDKIE